jgi:hypothetical protein
MRHLGLRGGELLQIAARTLELPAEAFVLVGRAVEREQPPDEARCQVAGERDARRRLALVLTLRTRPVEKGQMVQRVGGLAGVAEESLGSEQSWLRPTVSVGKLWLV